MEFSTTWDIDKYKSEFESEEHWNLRRRFMETHKTRFPEDKLVCLASVFFNIEFLGCRYPEKTMQLIAELSDGVADEHREKRKNKLKRTFVQASDAASAKIKRSSNPAESPAKKSKTDVPSTSSADPKQICFVHESMEQSEKIQEQGDFPGFIIFHSCNTRGEMETCPINILTMSAQKCPKWSPIKFTFLQNPSGSGQKYCEITLNNKLLASGVGTSQKDARIAAATFGLNLLRQSCYTIEAKCKYFSEENTLSKSEVNIVPRKVDNPLPMDNIGSRMMMKMGWTGSGLGKNKQGIQTPVQAAPKMIQRTGFGHFALNDLRKTFKKTFIEFASDDSHSDLVFSPDFNNIERKELHRQDEEDTDCKRGDSFQELFGSSDEDSLGTSHDLEELEPRTVRCTGCEKLGSITGEESKDDIYDMMWSTGSDTTGLVIRDDSAVIDIENTLNETKISESYKKKGKTRRRKIRLDEKGFDLLHVRYFLPDGSFMRVFGKSIKNNAILYNFTFPNGFKRIPSLLVCVTEEDIQRHPGLWEALLENYKVRKFPDGTRTFGKEYVPFPSQIPHSQYPTDYYDLFSNEYCDSYVTRESHTGEEIYDDFFDMMWNYNSDTRGVAPAQHTYPIGRGNVSSSILHVNESWNIPFIVDYNHLSTPTEINEEPKNFKSLQFKYSLPDGSFMQIFGKFIKNSYILYNFTFPNGYQHIPRYLVYVTQEDIQRHPGLWKALLDNHKVRIFPDGTSTARKDYIPFPSQLPEYSYCESLVTQGNNTGVESKDDFFGVGLTYNSDTREVPLAENTNPKTTGRGIGPPSTFNINESFKIANEVDGNVSMKKFRSCQIRYFLPDGSYLRIFGKFILKSEVLYNFTFPNGFQHIPHLLVNVTQEDIQKHPGLWEALLNTYKLRKFPDGTHTYSKEYFPFPSQTDDSSESSKSDNLLNNKYCESLVTKESHIAEESKNVFYDNVRKSSSVNNEDIVNTSCKDYVPFSSPIPESPETTKSNTDNSLKNESPLIKESESPENSKSSKTNSIIDPVEKIKIFLPDGSYKRVPVQDIINNEELKTFTNYTHENRVLNCVATFEDIKRIKALQELFSDFFLHSKLNSELIKEIKDSVGTDCFERNPGEKTATGVLGDKGAEEDVVSFDVNEQDLSSNLSNNFVNENSETQPSDNIISPKKDHTIIFPSQDNSINLSSYLNISLQEKELWRSKVGSIRRRYRVWFEDGSFIRIGGSIARKHPELLKAALKHHKVTVKDLESANHLGVMLQLKLSQLKSKLVCSRNLEISQDSQNPVLYCQDDKNTANTELLDGTSTQQQNNDTCSVIEQMVDTSQGDAPLKTLDQMDCEDKINPQADSSIKTMDQKDCEDKINPHGDSLLKTMDQKNCEDKLNPHGDSPFKTLQQKDCEGERNMRGDSPFKTLHQNYSKGEINPHGDSSFQTLHQNYSEGEINPHGDSPFQTLHQNYSEGEINPHGDSSFQTLHQNYSEGEINPHGDSFFQTLHQNYSEGEINPHGDSSFQTLHQNYSEGEINPHGDSSFQTLHQNYSEGEINPHGDSPFPTLHQNYSEGEINPHGDSPFQTLHQNYSEGEINPHGDSPFQTLHLKDCEVEINAFAHSLLKTLDQKDCEDEINHHDTNSKNCVRHSITPEEDRSVIKGSNRRRRRKTQKKIRLTLPDGTKLRFSCKYLEGNKYFKRYQERLENRNRSGLNNSVLPPEVYSDSSSDEYEQWVPKVKIPPVSESVINSESNEEEKKNLYMKKQWESFLISFGSSKTNPLSSKWRHFVDKTSSDSGSAEQSLSEMWSSFMALKESQYNILQGTSSEIVPSVSLISKSEPRKFVTSHFQGEANSYNLLGFTTNSTVPIIDDSLMRHLLEPGADSSVTSLDHHINTSGLTTHSTGIPSTISGSDLLTSHINSSTLMTVNSSTECPQALNVPHAINETEVISEFVKVKRKKVGDNAGTVTLFFPDGGKIRMEQSIVQKAIADRDSNPIRASMTLALKRP